VTRREAAIRRYRAGRGILEFETSEETSEAKSVGAIFEEKVKKHEGSEARTPTATPERRSIDGGAERYGPVMDSNSYWPVRPYKFHIEIGRLNLRCEETRYCGANATVSDLSWLTFVAMYRHPERSADCWPEFSEYRIA
jgi:hypothetical protein